MTARTTRRLAAAVLALVAWTPGLASAQYFGRNKVQYRTFHFEVLKTDHFDLYYYPEEAEAATVASRIAERWYARLSNFFSHQLRGRQALILYAVPAHFRQTNAIEGLIGEGTGGVTEALKRRIVLPMSGSLADTDHVIGHELVHAFQFDITGTDPRDTGGQAPGILDYPLWFVEGMAEYLSLGPVDAQTSMWLRDAALHEKLPDVKDLDDWHYFPYRWGQAFWAYIGAKYGDRTVASLIRSAANPRFDLAGLARQLGTDPDSLSRDWHQAIIASARLVADDSSSITSEPKLRVPVRTEAGRYNVGPRISPDGKRIAFFSERDRFSVDLYVADAANGRIERRLIRSATDPHFDSLEFLNSAGAWSPDGRTLVITAVRAGKPVLAFIDPASGRIERERPLPGLDDALNPAFAPDGRSLAVSGNHGGLIDLYRVPVDDGPIEQLTHDPFADLEPVFTPDGQSLVFVTERFSTDLATLAPGPLRLARLDLATREVSPIPGFLHGKHLSPQVSPDGRTVTFIADPDGVSNLYRMPIDGGPIERLTSFVTGVAGITASSPALSMSADGSRLAFSVFEDGGHAIYTLDKANTVAEVAPVADGRGALIAGRARPAGEVFSYLSNETRGLPPVTARPGTEPYRRGLSLDVIGQPTVTAGVSSFGTYVGGSMSAYFTDMLGDRALGLAAQVGGALADLGGQAVYASRKHRWNWAAAAEQLPYRVGYLTFDQDATTNQVRLAEVIERQTTRGVFGVAAFPFNSATRFEVSGGAHQLTFTRQTRTAIYDGISGKLLDRTNDTVSLAAPLYLAESSVALVHDTSYFGATGPLYGARSRIEIGRSAGTVSYSSLLVDVRRYFMPRSPITLAFRGLHYGRYGSGSDDIRLVGLYAGYPEFVHGYGVGSFSAADCTGAGNEGGDCGVFDSLIGSRLLVANAEVRAPLLGLFTGKLDYGRIPVDVAAFYDAGVAWTRTTRPSFAGGTRHLVRSAGVAARINAFGFFVVEIAASRPFDRLTKGWQWQVGLRQGF